MSNNLLHQFLTLGDDDLPDVPTQATHSFLWPPAVASFTMQAKVEERSEEAIPPNWGHLILDSPSSGTSSSLDCDDPANLSIDLPCLPGGLSQISSMHGDSRSPSPDMSGLPGAFFSFSQSAVPQQENISSVTLRPAAIALDPTSLHTTRALSPPVVHMPSPSPNAKPKRGAAAQAPVQQPHQPHPHPYSISPSNTTALFTRASSVSSNTPTPGLPTKKSRAPPSGPISTKDFIPPDVSGLSKREARLVKNRAAAFLSRQRKREEFEGLEGRVEVLEADNARLQQELESYRSGDAMDAGTASTTAALTAELTALRRQLASRDAEIAKMNAKVKIVGGVQEQLATHHQLLAQKDVEIAELKRTIASGLGAIKREEDCDESDSEDAQSTVGGKKDLKSAGSMAFMVLLFSLSTLLTNTSGQATHSKASPKSSQPARRPGYHRRSDSNLGLPFSDSFNVYESFGPSLSFDPVMLSSPSFGYDEDTLMGGSIAGPSTSTLPSGGLSADSAFAGLSASSSIESLQQATGSAISSVQSIGPNEFEFDFDMPAASGSSSPKKIAVRVKSALPLDLDLSALNQAKPTPAASSSSDIFAGTVPSPFDFRPDDLDFSWSSTAPASDSKKRKRVVVEIQPSSEPRPNKRRAGEQQEERWDVQFSEDLDEDVAMRS